MCKIPIIFFVLIWAISFRPGQLSRSFVWQDESIFVHSVPISEQRGVLTARERYKIATASMKKGDWLGAIKAFKNFNWDKCDIGISTVRTLLKRAGSEIFTDELLGQWNGVFEMGSVKVKLYLIFDEDGTFREEWDTDGEPFGLLALPRAFRTKGSRTGKWKINDHEIFRRKGEPRHPKERVIDLGFGKKYSIDDRSLELICEDSVDPTDIGKQNLVGAFLAEGYIEDNELLDTVRFELFNGVSRSHSK